MSDFIQLEYLQEKLQQLLAESLFAIYLYGSAVDGGLGPESDLDVLVVVTQPLTSALREQLAQELLKISQPVGELQRPLEVTILLKDEIQSGNYPLSYEMQFGEWLREELKEGGTLSSQKDPDISILLRKARFHHAVLFGPALDQWAPEISDQELWQAMSDTYPEIVAHWDEDADERNQILALCRIYFSLVMKDIASKDNAARWVMSQLPPEQKFVLQRLIQEYRGEIGKQNWQEEHYALQPIVNFLSSKIEEQFEQKRNLIT